MSTVAAAGQVPLMDMLEGLEYQRAVEGLCEPMLSNESRPRIGPGERDSYALFSDSAFDETVVVIIARGHQGIMASAGTGCCSSRR
jgi:hypothetical protein